MEKKPPKPKFLTVGEEKLWRARFDPEQFLTITEIAASLKMDHKSLQVAASKLCWNLLHGFQTHQTVELIALAARVTEVKVENNPYLVLELVTRRTQQVNWERRHRKTQPRE